MEDEFICTLHSKVECTHANYNHRTCKLDVQTGFALSSCIYRLKAIYIEPERDGIDLEMVSESLQ